MADRANEGRFRWLQGSTHEFDLIQRRLVQEAAAVIPGLSPDPQLTDPVVRLLLSAVARESQRIYEEMDDVVDLAYRRLYDQLLSFPRGPLPASTVLQLEVKDPGTLASDALIAVGRKAVPGPAGNEQVNLHFSPGEESAVAGLPDPVVVFDDGRGNVRCLDAPNASRQWTSDATETPRIFLGIDLPENHPVDELALFVWGPEIPRDQALWSPWSVGGERDRLVTFPAEQHTVQPWHRGPEPQLFRARSDTSLPFSPYERYLVHLGRDFVERGVGQAPTAVEAGVERGVLPTSERRSWVRVELREAATLEGIDRLSFRFNCVIAHNVHQRARSYKLGTESEQVVDLPVQFDQLLAIATVDDLANTVHYLDAETPEGLHSENRYYFDAGSDGRSRLRLSAARTATRPRNVQVQYLTTFGVEADGLDAGSIDVIYDRSRTPGIENVVNVVPSIGGETAEERPDLASDLRALLSTRTNAVTRHDFVRLTRAFDPRVIEDVEVGRGVTIERHDGGQSVRSCVQVRATVRGEILVGPRRREAFRRALHDHLQQRTVVGQPVEVELLDAEASA